MAQFPMMFQLPGQENNPASLIGTKPKPANYMDAAQIFQLPQKNEQDELRSMGILDRAEIDNRYAEGMADRDDQRKKFAIGQAIGALAGVMGGRLFGNTNAAQNVQNVLPAISGTQAMLQHNAQQDQLAAAEHNAAVKNYYDALYKVRGENDAINLHNQETNLGLYKADMARKERPVKMGTHMETKNGRTYEVTDYGDPNSGAVFSQQDREFTPHVGNGSSNEIRENTAFVAIRDLMKEKEKEEGDLVDKKNAILARIRENSDPAKNTDKGKYDYNAENIAKDKAEYAALDKQHKELVSRYNGRLAEIQKAVKWDVSGGNAANKVMVKGGGSTPGVEDWTKKKITVKKSN